jgi:hypothetical protein
MRNPGPAKNSLCYTEQCILAGTLAGGVSSASSLLPEWEIEVGFGMGIDDGMKT